jgi:hypothetical protein
MKLRDVSILGDDIWRRCPNITKKKVSRLEMVVGEDVKVEKKLILCEKTRIGLLFVRSISMESLND